MRTHSARGGVKDQQSEVEGLRISPRLQGEGLGTHSQGGAEDPQSKGEGLRTHSQRGRGWGGGLITGGRYNLTSKHDRLGP